MDTDGLVWIYWTQSFPMKPSRPMTCPLYYSSLSSLWAVPWGWAHRGYPSILSCFNSSSPILSAIHSQLCVLLCSVMTSGGHEECPGSCAVFMHGKRYRPWVLRTTLSQGQFWFSEFFRCLGSRVSGPWHMFRAKGFSRLTLNDCFSDYPHIVEVMWLPEEVEICCTARCDSSYP